MSGEVGGKDSKMKVKAQVREGGRGNWIPFTTNLYKWERDFLGQKVNGKAQNFIFKYSFMYDDTSTPWGAPHLGVS